MTHHCPLHLQPARHRHQVPKKINPKTQTHYQRPPASTLKEVSLCPNWILSVMWNPVQWLLVGGKLKKLKKTMPNSKESRQHTYAKLIEIKQIYLQVRHMKEEVECK